MKVTREVDTVIVEMDISTADKVLVLLTQTVDNTMNFGDLAELAILLNFNGGVRSPSARYIPEVESGMVYIRNTTADESRIRRAAQG